MRQNRESDFERTDDVQIGDGTRREIEAMGCCDAPAGRIAGEPDYRIGRSRLAGFAPFAFVGTGSTGPA